MPSVLYGRLVEALGIEASIDVALCDSAMNGTVYNWKASFSTQLVEAKKDVMEVKEGEYKCKFTFIGKLIIIMKVLMFLEQTWPAHKDWSMEK